MVEEFITFRHGAVKILTHYENTPMSQKELWVKFVEHGLDQQLRPRKNRSSTPDATLAVEVNSYSINTTLDPVRLAKKLPNKGPNLFEIVSRDPYKWKLLDPIYEHELDNPRDNVALLIGKKASPHKKLEKYVVRAIRHARAAERASGTTSIRIAKQKRVKFSSDEEFRRYVSDLRLQQKNKCALTGLEMQYDMDYTDELFIGSLDRIDSAKDYEQGNVQWVCRIINYLKSDLSQSDAKKCLKILANAPLLKS